MFSWEHRTVKHAGPTYSKDRHPPEITSSLGRKKKQPPNKPVGTSRLRSSGPLHWMPARKPQFWHSHLNWNSTSFLSAKRLTSFFPTPSSALFGKREGGGGRGGREPCTSGARTFQLMAFLTTDRKREKTGDPCHNLWAQTRQFFAMPTRFKNNYHTKVPVGMGWVRGRVWDRRWGNFRGDIDENRKKDSWQTLARKTSRLVFFRTIV